MPAARHRRPTDDNVASVRGAGAAVLARAPIAAATPGVALRLVFVDAASGTTRGARAVQVGEVFASQVLPYFDQYALSHRFWSADSRYVFFISAAHSLRVFDRETRNIKSLGVNNVLALASRPI